MASLYITKTSHEITTLCFSKATKTTKMHEKKFGCWKQDFKKKGGQRKHPLPFSSQIENHGCFPKPKVFLTKKTFKCVKEPWYHCWSFVTKDV